MNLVQVHCDEYVAMVIKAKAQIPPVAIDAIDLRLAWLNGHITALKEIKAEMEGATSVVVS